MPLLPSLGRAVGSMIRWTRLLGRGSLRSGRWAGRKVGAVRTKGAGGEIGMTRLLDLHAASYAGDILIAIGLAGTIFFSAPIGEARSGVAIYLLVTMIPFAVLAPVVGPLLDHFRHGRRYALATTMLGRAFLAWLMSDYIHGFGLYPAAFGVLALSRAYGVARSAAVPRLLPEGMGLSQAAARAGVYGMIAGAAVTPIGLLAFKFGPQWPLRVASIIFLVGMVVALRLPPKADSDPPEALPRPFAAMGLRRGDRALTGRLVIATLISSAALRGLYGFLLLFLAFAIKAGDLTTMFLGRDVGDELALGIAGGGLAVGGFLATAIGTRMRIHRPAALQSSGLIIVAGVAVLATLKFSLAMVALLCLVTAFMSGISKLAVDASIQERIGDRQRASAFAHSETVLMVAWVAGGALGLIPFQGRMGIAVVSVVAVVAAVRAVIVAGKLRKDKLHGRADPSVDSPPPASPQSSSSPSTPPDAPPPPPAQATRRRREAPPEPAPKPAEEKDAGPPPGFHVYRPSSGPPT
ncbi:MFS transporter [Phytohabitans kaempferiae]|uniref:MFS transporter n=1 Tax=Phytohabitans kaempferiae TaxID=1620943 RepID=A0ABV6LWB2_9ACTN